jgi:RNA polymerase sigma-70 factor (ECF subfamily)
MPEPEGGSVEPSRGVTAPESEATGLESVRTSVGLALDHGDVEEARRLIADADIANVGAELPAEWVQLRDVTAWPDAWLVAAVRGEPPDVAALDALVGRYWKPLFARCELLTMNRDVASDLAQETWSRVLRARRALDPDGNFPGYLSAIALNIWRDWSRSARRAGPLASHRVVSLDAGPTESNGDTVLLRDAISDVNAMPLENQVQLKVDLDRALAALTPRSRAILVARYLDGESASEIGARYGRTEQMITAWIRQAIHDVRQQLVKSSHPSTRMDRQ